MASSGIVRFVRGSEVRTCFGETLYSYSIVDFTGIRPLSTRQRSRGTHKWSTSTTTYHWRAISTNWVKRPSPNCVDKDAKWAHSAASLRQPNLRAGLHQELWNSINQNLLTTEWPLTLQTNYNSLTCRGRGAGVARNDVTSSHQLHLCYLPYADKQTRQTGQLFITSSKTQWTCPIRRLKRFAYRLQHCLEWVMWV